MHINERFTDIADKVSEGMGKWWVTATSIGVVLIWLLSGPYFHVSDTWQLIINTPTTILEMWIGFLIAAAANRVERRDQDLMEKIEHMAEHIESLVVQENQEITQIEQRMARPE